MKKAFGEIKTEITPTNDQTQDLLVAANQELAETKRAQANMFGGDAILPSAEFSGGMYGGGVGNFGGMGGAGSGDIYSWPGRYQQGLYGAQSQGGGWYYRRQGQSIDHQRIAQCIMLYKTEGIVQTIVHLLADFATEGVRIAHENDSVNNFYKAWAQKINIKDRIHRFVVDLLHTGNVFIWRKEAKLKPGEKTAMKRGQAYAIADQLYDDKHKAIGDLTRDVPKGTKIPWGYVSLNPLQMDVRGSRFIGDHHWAMMLTRDDVQRLGKNINRGSGKYAWWDDIADTEINLPNELKGKLKKSTKKGLGQYEFEVELSKDRLTVVQDITKADYEAWATPSIYPAYKEVMTKRLMRAGEMSALESLKHMITLIKLGDTKEGLAPTPEAIRRVASSLAAGAQSHYLVWDDLIDGKVLQPNIGQVLDPKKYESINEDIFMALGISKSVMTGQGSYSNSFLSIKLLLEKLETIREKMLNWLMFELKIIAERMNFRNLPEVRFGIMNLRDENTERKLMMELFDRGIVSQETLLEYFELTYSHEHARQLRERHNIEKDNVGIKEEELGKKPDAPVMMPTGPYRKTERPKDLPTPPMPTAPTVKQPKNNKAPVGRPGGDGKKQEKRRETKPQGLGQLEQYDKARVFVSGAYPIVKRCVSQHIVDLHDLNELSGDKLLLAQALSHLVMTQIVPDQKITENLVYNKLGIVRSNKAVATNNPMIHSLSLVVQEGMSSQEIDELFIRIYASYHSGLLEEES